MAEIGKTAFDVDDSLSPSPILESQEQQDPANLSGSKSKIQN